MHRSFSHQPFDFMYKSLSMYISDQMHLPVDKTGEKILQIYEPYLETIIS